MKVLQLDLNIKYLYLKLLQMSNLIQAQTNQRIIPLTIKGKH